MLKYKIEAIHTEKPIKNKGILGEWALAAHYGVERNTHDHTRYDEASDICAAGKNISVKADRFTLMSGKLCGGIQTFDGIWNLFRRTVHSDTFAYITLDMVVYEMNLNEFQQFVFKFCSLQRESTKNGGGMKIRARHESKAMLAWLDNMAA